MVALYEFELGKAADILTRELFKLKEGETYVITADTESDMRVVKATARAAFSLRSIAHGHLDCGTFGCGEGSRPDASPGRPRRRVEGRRRMG